MSVKKITARTRRVRFRVHIEGAREVVVAGEFTNWSQVGVRLSLAPKKKNEWRGFLHLQPGEYQYRLIVDGEWRDNPDAPRRVPNPFGSENCVLTVS